MRQRARRAIKKKDLAPGIITPSYASGQVLLRHLSKDPNRLHCLGPVPLIGPGLLAFYVNFPCTAFSEVGYAFLAKTLLNSTVGQPLGKQFLGSLGPPASLIS